MDARAVTHVLAGAGMLALLATYASVLLPPRYYRALRVPVLMLDLHGEANLGAFFSATLLLFCAALLAVLGLGRRQRRAPAAWCCLLLAGGFVLAGADEVGMIHEQVSRVIRRRFEPEGLLYHGWVVPGAAFVLFFAASCWRILGTLPERHRRLFLLGSMLLVGGALGCEMIEGWLITSGRRSYVPVTVFLDEALELAGELLLLHALMLQAAFEGATLRFRGPKSAA